jgi:hypothetical protein
MSEKSKQDPIANKLPNDLMTLRETESRLHISVATLRRWINLGKCNRKLQTYHVPESIHTTLVSEKEVIHLIDARPRRTTHRRQNKGAISLRLEEENADQLRRLATLLTSRIGVPINYADTARMAIEEKLQREEKKHGKS